MTASLRAETLKLGRRPAVWITGVLWILSAFVFGYLIGYLLLDSQQMAQAGVSSEQLLPGLLPEGLVGNVLSGFPQFGFAVALILGGMATGSEYGWRTVGTTLVQGPTRTAVYGGRVLALAAITAVLTLVPFAIGAASSAGIAALEDAPRAWPAATAVLRALGWGWLIMGVGAALGMVLATVLRTTGLAVGLGLIYILVVESLFAGFASQSTVIETTAKLLPGVNAGGLAAATTVTPDAGGAPGVTNLVGPTRATVTLLIQLVGFLTVGAVVFNHRDITG